MKFQIPLANRTVRRARDFFLLLIKSLNQNKALGLDGLSVEFYLKFWDLLGHQLLDVINSWFARGKICDSMRASATWLVYKKRSNIKNVKKWPPISLLNTNYKICLKAIPLQLSKVLDSIIDPDQTCSITGRTISNNIAMQTAYAILK